MGEMADFALEELGDIEYGPHGPYDGFDNVMYDDSSGTYLGPGNAVMTCRYCGHPNLTWAARETGYRLINNDGSLHTCTAYHKQRS